MKTRTWILLFALLAAACLGASVLLRLSGRNAAAAELLVDGAVYKTVDLTRDRVFMVETEFGENTVEVKDGEISVTAASCPDKVCVAHGPARAGDPAVCLPNRLVVRIVTDAPETDAVTG